MTHTLARGVILAVVLAFSATVAHAQQYAAVVMDARTGQVIHARNADTRLHPASLTKMMTLYVVFDEVRRGRLSLDQKVTISRKAAAEPPSKLGLRPGQQIELRYLIRAAAIRSANDAATALGEAVAGSEEAFAQRMNAYARAMGMTNTTFRNAHGLTQAGHLSTARDMAILGRRLTYDFPQYYNLYSRRSTSAGIATVQNTNRRLLDAYPGADGIKTGYTRAAGFNLVSSAQRGDRRVIVSLFGGQSSASRNAEVARLMDLGFAQMPARAAVASLPPLRLASAPATGEALAAAAGSAAAGSVSSSGSASTAGVARGASATQLARVDRPMPRGATRSAAAVTRNVESIADAIAQVNAELEQGSDRGAIVTAGARPVPRPGMEAAQVAAAGGAALGSTFMATAAPTPARGDGGVRVADVGAASTGGNAWGVQLGAFRAKGDAERHLLTTALRDVPELDGGLRRIEAVSTQGVTVYRAQFVGMSREAAMAACSRLVRQQAECTPIEPGI
jgi:D-alanyl-D-alanine carboxypeptidase